MPIRSVLLLLVVLVPPALLTAVFSDPPAAHPAPALPTAPSLVRAFVEGAWTLLWWATENPRVAGAVAGVVLLPMVATAVVRAIPRAVHTDAQRLFTSGQRKEGFDRAGGRCEAETWLFRRCRRPATQGDHWFPWSLGGASSMENFAALCAVCNRRKSAKVPTVWQTWRLSMRRRRYFPAHLDVRAGGKTFASR